MSRNTLLIVLVVILFGYLLFGGQIKERLCASTPSLSICQTSLNVQVNPDGANGTLVQIQANLPSLTTVVCILIALGFILTAWGSGNTRNWGIGIGTAGIIIWVLDVTQII